MATLKYEVKVKLIDLAQVQELVAMLDTAVMLLQGITPQTKTIGQSWFESKEKLILKIYGLLDELQGEDE